MLTEDKKRVCVIGAGPSGMSVLYYFARLGKDSPEVVCYEKGSKWGGQWNYTWRIGTDEFGEKICSGIYRDMWVNLPKEVMELAHYTFDQHFGKTIPSYFPASVMVSYLEGYWKSSSDDLSKKIRFSTPVSNVHYNVDSDDFTVVTRDLVERKTNPPESFSHVIVASGMFTMPNVPEFKGLDTFPGRIMHSHQFRGGHEFKGQRILVIGSSFSAEDVTFQCYKYGAGHVIISWKQRPLGYTFPSNVEERPLLVEVEGHVAKFKDGSSSEVDAIIMCTGYRYDYSFLEDSSNLIIDCLRITGQQTAFYADGLYKGIVWLKGGNGKLLYVGALWLVTSVQTTDTQAVWVVQYITGRSPIGLEGYKTKSLQASTKEVQEYVDKIKEHTPKVLDVSGFTKSRIFYIRDLADDTGYRIDIELIAELLKQCFATRLDKVLEFRDHQFTSVYTGKQSDPPTTKWLDYFGDDPKQFM